MEARSAAAEMLKKTDAGGAKRYRHEELGSDAVEEVKRQRVAVPAFLPYTRQS
jgi:hypothetical protein